MTWTALIDPGAEREQYRAVAEEILAALPGPRRPGHVAQDWSDRALLAAYLDRTMPVDAELANAVHDLAESGAAGPGLYGGASHVGWTLAHLADGPDAAEVCEAIEARITAQIDTAQTHFDVISGLAGIAVMGLERSSEPSGRALSRRVLDALEATARPRGPGVAWFTQPAWLPPMQRALSPDGYWNLGLAHGSPGVIAALARIVRAGIERARALALLEAAVAALLDSEPPRVDGRFSCWHAPARDEDRSVRRVAWCYGDLGVAVAVLAAARATGRADWEHQAIELACAAARCPDDAASILDTGLCHGAAGAAHLFNRLYHATGTTLLADAARHWLRRTLAMRRCDGLAGFPAREAGHGIWNPDPSLLAGAAGVGLALVAATSDLEPEWDRLLLADF
jgi:lantibiotic biosynthesis protein